MTPEAQRIAIAEACGWRGIEYRSSPTNPSGYCGEDKSKDWLGATKIPDYLSDLNAMHAAEKVLKKVPDYWNALWSICRKAQGGTEDLQFDIMRATAAQRAEAFLRALGKWTD